MGRIPEALVYADSRMKKLDLIKAFKVPERNLPMARALNEFLSRGGKYLRPALVFSTIKTFGVASVNLGYWAALAIHLFHNYFLIDDDIEDKSRKRRGKPCLHLLYGTDFAMNYGAYLRTLGEESIDSGRSAWKLHNYTRMRQATLEMLKTTCEGQDLEFMLRVKPLSEMSRKKVMEIYDNKSAFYTVYTPTRYGMIISRVPDDQINETKPGLIKVGQAFQIDDDVLDVIKPKEEEIGKANLKEQKFGKDWAGDLEEIKRTLPLQLLCERVTSDDRTYIYEMFDIDGRMRKLVAQRDMLLDEKVSEDDPRYQKIVGEVDQIKSTTIDMMHKYKAIEDSQEIASKLYETGIKQIEPKLPDTEGKKELLELFHFAVFRKF